MRPILRTAALVLAIAAADAADDVDREVARWRDEVDKARAAYQVELGKANDKALRALARIAQREARGGDDEAAAQAWKAVLAIDFDDADARAWFTAAGRLDDVMAELAASQDPLGVLSGGAPRAALILPPGSALTPTGNVLQAPFAQRTVELLVSQVAGDGVIYEEGGAAIGQALVVEGDEVRWLMAAGDDALELRGAFDRTAPWTHIAAQFDAGEATLWIDGRPAQRAKAPFAEMPAHAGDGCIGGERKGSVAKMPKNAASFRLAMFRLSDAARFAAPFRPPEDAIADKATVLAIGSANLAGLAMPTPPPARGKTAEPAARIKAFVNTPDANISWQVNGDVSVTAR